MAMQSLHFDTYSTDTDSQSNTSLVTFLVLK